MITYNTLHTLETCNEDCGIHFVLCPTKSLAHLKEESGVGIGLVDHLNIPNIVNIHIKKQLN